MSIRSPKYAQKDRMSATLNRFGVAHNAFRATKPTPQEVRAMDIRVIVAQPEWQQIRHDFIGTWKNKEKIPSNIKRLEAWLGDGSDPIKVRQILNYVTGSGFRIGIISDPKISQFRNYVRNIWSNLLNSNQ